MKIGGVAHFNGITFYGDAFKVKTLKKSNRIIQQVNWITKPKWFKRMDKIPLLKIISIIYYQWIILDIKMKILLMVTGLFYILEEYVNIPFISSFIASRYFYPFAAIIGVILVFVYRKRITQLFRYHGAEHKVINCYINYGCIDFFTVKNSSRFNRRCGTNLVMLYLILYLILWLLKFDSFTSSILLFIVAIIVNKKIIQLKSHKYDKYINFFQRITVWQPKDEEINIAIMGFDKLYQAHLIYHNEIFHRSRPQNRQIPT